MSTHNPQGPRGAAPDPDPGLTALLKLAHVETHDVYNPDDRRSPNALKDECRAFYRDLRFDAGIARARRDEGWEHDPLARLYVGIGRMYQRRYDEAREEFRVAASLSDRDNFKASCLANEGLCWFEQADDAKALEAYERALVLSPTNEFALLGPMYVACLRRDKDALIDAGRRLMARRPEWRESESILEQLLKDRSLRYLRQMPGLFEKVFGVSLETIQSERRQSL